MASCSYVTVFFPVHAHAVDFCLVCSISENPCVSRFTHAPTSSGSHFTHGIGPGADTATAGFLWPCIRHPAGCSDGRWQKTGVLSRTAVGEGCRAVMNGANLVEGRFGRTSQSLECVHPLAQQSK